MTASNLVTSGEYQRVAAILEQGLKNKRYVKSRFGNSYCGACCKTHAKQWFEIQGNDARFYVCIAGAPSFVVQHAGNYENFAPDEFVRRYPSKASFWKVFGKRKLDGAVVLSTVPPFVHVEIRFPIS